MAAAEAIRVLEFYSAVDRGDMASSMSIFAPNVVWVESPFPPNGGGVAHGPKEIAEKVLGPFTGLFAKLELVRDRVIAQGAEVVVLGRYWGVMKETGRTVVSRFSHAWTMKDGRATRMEQLADTAALFLAAGYELTASVAGARPS